MQKSEGIDRYIAACIFLLALLPRLIGALWEPSGRLYNVDELSLSHSAHESILGLTPTTLAWPSATLILPLSVFYTIRGLSYENVFSAISRRSPGVLLTDLTLANANYQLNPWPDIVLGRVLVAVIAAFAPLFSFHLLRSRSWSIALSCSIFLATSPALVEQSWSLQVDGAAVTPWVICLILMLWHDPWNSKITLVRASAALGATIASKFIYGAFLPIGLALFIMPNRSFRNQFTYRLRQAGHFLAITLITFVLLCPFIWTAPVTIGKSFVGNILVKAANTGSILEFIPSLFLAFVGAPGLILVIAGMLLSFRRLAGNQTTLLFIVFAIFLLPASQAKVARYALPLIPVMAIWGGIGFSELYSVSIGGISQQFRHRVAGIFLIGVILWNTLVFGTSLMDLHWPTNADKCAGWIETNIDSGSRIGIPRAMDVYLVPNATTLMRIIEQNEDETLVEQRLRRVTGEAQQGIGSPSGKISPDFRRVFGEDEQQRAHMAKRLLWFVTSGTKVGRPTFEIHSYTIRGEQPRVEDIDYEGAVQMHRGGQLDYLVTSTTMLQDPRRLMFSSAEHLGSGCFVYGQ